MEEFAVVVKQVAIMVVSVAEEKRVVGYLVVKMGDLVEVERENGGQCSRPW